MDAIKLSSLLRAFVESLETDDLPFKQAVLEGIDAVGASASAAGAGHTVTRPSDKDLLCILSRIYPEDRLKAYSPEQLFGIYKKNIEAGTIPYDKSKGYAGNACPAPTPPSSGNAQPQANANPVPSKRSKFAAEEATDAVSRLYKKAGK